MKDIFNTNSNLSQLNNPFHKDKISAIHMHAFPRDYGFEWSASIEFTNKQTVGTQKFKEDSFGNLTEKMKVFIESLSKDIK